MAKKKNQYDYVSSSFVANELEKTQINKFHTKGGTGFAAEEINGLNDSFRGHKVEQTGKKNELNGSDRVVDGIHIQTKYFSTARDTVDSAFGADGNYRYGSQLLEVPRDQYDSSVELMRERIRQGKVPGFADPTEAELLVKKGDVTYAQAKNIAKAGNIDSLVFDVKSQSVTSSYAFAISFSINFAKLKWDGKTSKQAITDALVMGFESGATSLITGIATAQILRTRAAAIGVVSMRSGVKTVVQTKIGKGFVSNLAQASLGKSVYGAAATNHVAKILRTNVVTSVVTTVVISTPDFYRAAFRGSISWTQFAKNLTTNAASVAGGVGGWMGGAALGAAAGSAVPLIGTAIGGFVGGMVGALAGGTVSSAASKYILDGLIEDDAKEMIRLLPDCLQPLASDYLLSEEETKEFATALKEKIDASFLREMYRSVDRFTFVYQSFESACEVLVAKRPKVSLPAQSEVLSELAILEESVFADGLTVSAIG